MTDQAYQGVAPLWAFTNPFNQKQFQISQLINAMATATLVMVKAVHSAGLGIGTVDIQPLVSQVDGSGNPIWHDVICGVPYVRMQAGAWALIIDPQVGDVGLCGFCMRDISKVKATGAAALPGSMRTYDWADGVYIGMCLSAVTPTQYVQFTSSGINIVSGDTVTTISSTGVVISGDTGNLSVAGNLSAGNGITCSFTTSTGQIVTVQNGIVTNLF